MYPANLELFVRTLRGRIPLLGQAFATLLRQDTAEANREVADITSGTVALQLETAARILVERLEPDGPEVAGEYAGGWLRLVASMNLTSFLDMPVPSEDLNRFEGSLNEALRDATLEEDLSQIAGSISKAICRALARPAAGALRVLFIGDCLVWDIAVQLQILSGRGGIDVSPTVIARRVGADLRWGIADLAQHSFDLIFYAPFGLGFSPAYARFLDPRSANIALLREKANLDEALADCQLTIRLLSERFECPLYIHTASGIRQTQLGAAGFMADAFTWLARRYARRRVNNVLIPYLAAISSFSRARVINTIDEEAPLSKFSARKLGTKLFDAGELHPTLLAYTLASDQYLKICQAAVKFKGKKLVVCDLDNTLWDGVIGDGPVIQHATRQRTLLELKKRGVVLAVSSKNDPKNVRWEDCLLSPSDFVSMEINWRLKSSNIRKIGADLNLLPTSFVFLDDRPDERETVMSDLPGVLALDPNDQSTWDQVEAWASMLSSSELSDRTAMYQERALRQEFLSSEADNKSEMEKAYSKLSLKVTLRNPGPGDLNRVLELINRTNQFNTTSARINLRELSEISSTGRVIVAEARDRFGEMGLVGALVSTVEETPQITHFVLSCRVFGFYMEHAMLQSLLQYFAECRVSAALVKTPVNGPCQEVFSKNGFEFIDNAWISGFHQPVTIPKWLTVVDHCALPK